VGVSALKPLTIQVYQELILCVKVSNNGQMACCLHACGVVYYDDIIRRRADGN